MRKRAGIDGRTRLWVIVTLAICGTILLLRPGCHREPPDLTGCTRIDVHYTYGALYHFFPYSPMQESMLSEEERQHVRSFDKWTVTNPEQIRAFADQLRQGEHRGRIPGKILAVLVEITCYRGANRVASFSVYPPSPTVHANGHRFSYEPGVPILRSLDPPKLKSLKARWECATNLSALVFEGLWFGRKGHTCPDPNHWCDAVLKAYRRLYIIHKDQNDRRERMFPDSGIARRFTCPGVHASADVNDAQPQPDETDPFSQPPDSWVSYYAMNSNCREGSPDDVVFLFESKPGWNQHGGPELFTFDNHDPRGGCVLLNDGTVRFIRTEEELHALRWK